ncbi:MAG TPA: N-acetylmuramoyl-L-alanine amidase [Stellaceae bacterium]|nr:N-acetylmuramoyl-L-alanine amidase [Stellaceae bacterium]
MRDTTIARRALLALAAGIAICFWPAGPADSRSRAARDRPKVEPPKPKRKPRTIALDAGHGGIDPGAISPRGIKEKTITLAMARELERQLKASGRYRVALTRRRDILVPLRERIARARRHRAELFLSIHADALPEPAIRGLSVYTLSEQASDRETALLAARENKDDFVLGLKMSKQPPVIGAILLDLTRRETNNRSLVLARAIVEAAGREVRLLPKPHRSADFAVLSAPDIPSALIEIGCLSNPDEERLLPTPSFQRRLAQALMRAIDDYFAGTVRT